MSLLTKSMPFCIYKTYLKPNFIDVIYCLSPLTKYLSAPVIQVRGYAARKGIRERKKKLKVKVEEKKIGFIPHNQRNKEKFLLSRPKLKFDESWLGLPKDDVYPYKYYKWKVYSFAEAVQCHCETHHPEMYNQPNANLHVTIELNMEGEKKNRFLENIFRMAAVPHKFDHGEERSLIAFTKTDEMQLEATNAGAQLAGGTDLIKQIQNGEISLQDFQFVVAHPNILPELVVLRGLMKKKFPNVKNGSLDVNLPETVNKFLHGINYSAVKDEYEKDFAAINTIIGTLNMGPKMLEENFAALVRDVYEVKPKRAGTFITRCLLWSPPSCGKLKVDHNLYIDRLDVGEQIDDSVDNDEEEEKAAVV